MKNPKVFISYSWDSQEHEDWVIVLANKLRKIGIDAMIDKFITQKGTVNLNRMMIENIRDADYTLVVLTDIYAEKADSFKGGVGYETTLLISETEENLEKIIPIIRFKGDTKRAIPYYLKGATYIDFSNDESYGERFEELKYKIFRKDRIQMEPLGELPNLKSRKVTMDSLQRNMDINNDLIPDFRGITDRDKNRFMKESYALILEELSQLSKQTKLKNPNFDYEVEVVTTKKSILKYYIDDMEKHIVKIWLSNMISKEEDILIAYGHRYADNDNSWNERVVCKENDKKELELEMTMNMFGNKSAKGPNEIAVEIWKKIQQYFR